MVDRAPDPASPLDSGQPDPAVEPRWPAIVAMSGLPFARKSTLARALAARLGATLIEVDRLVEGREGLPAGPIPERLWFAAYRRAEALVRAELSAGRRVVYDGVNFRWVQREKLRRLAREVEQHVLVVHVTTPLAAILARQRANLIDPVRPVVDRETFEVVRDRFEPPRLGEWAVSYDGIEPVDEWLARVGATLVDPDAAGETPC